MRTLKKNESLFRQSKESVKSFFNRKWGLWFTHNKNMMTILEKTQWSSHDSFQRNFSPKATLSLLCCVYYVERDPLCGSMRHGPRKKTNLSIRIMECLVPLCALRPKKRKSFPQRRINALSTRNTAWWGRRNCECIVLVKGKQGLVFDRVSTDNKKSVLCQSSEPMDELYYRPSDAIGWRFSAAWNPRQSIQLSFAVSYF